jgi:GTP-binding protein
LGQSGRHVPQESDDLSPGGVKESSTAEPDFVERGRRLFAGECSFLWAAAEAAKLPPPGMPEIAFAGRSNVGKSTLLNALTNRKNLARTSRTPGRTQELNFFVLKGGDAKVKLHLVDMPGYGYAATSKEKAASWSRLIEAFLRGRAQLARVFLLIDGRHGAKPIDIEMLDLLDRSAVSYQIVLTKRDEVGPMEREKRLVGIRALIAKRSAAFPEVMFTSSLSGEGIGELRAAIARLLAESGS